MRVLILIVRTLASIVNFLFRYLLLVPTSDKLCNAISSQIVLLLKEERERQKLSLNRLSEKAGLSRQTIAYVEGEVENPILDTLLRIALGLNVDLGKIISRAQKNALKNLSR